MVNPGRLLNTFIELIRIDSLSRSEREVGLYCQRFFQRLGLESFFDGSSKRVGGDCGNLITRLPGTQGSVTLMLCAHLDTVNPGKNIKPIVEGDVVRSDGSTILGADDKAGVAIILEVIQTLRERSLPHPTLEIVFTVCEEIGLLGAKELDYDLINASWGIVLDGGSINEITNQAPSANRFTFKIYGKEAHAGVAPELGLNAIVLASQVISRLRLGRIDEESTANIGLIQGGIATNIVPNLVELKGEVRSHDPEKLSRITEEICQAFKELEAHTYEGIRPRVMSEVQLDYPVMKVSEGHPLIKELMRAGQEIGLELRLKKGGGGSDANIFNARGINSVIVGTGMSHPHTVNEILKIDEMVKCASLLLRLLGQLAQDPLTMGSQHQENT